MKPICFPSTCIPDFVSQALTACFGQFVVYQPVAGKIPVQMRPWVEKGVLDIRVPVTGDQNQLETLVKNYLSWADLNFDGSGLKPPLLQTWKDAIPFFKASSTSRLVADIKEQLHGKPVSNALDPLLAARLFLYFAQEFDRQNQEVALDLERHRQKEAELIRRLKMEDDSLAAGFQKADQQKPNDSADYMVLDRLRAWTRLLLKDTDISGIFISHNPTVLQELLDQTPTAEKLLFFESIPISMPMTEKLTPWREQLLSALSHIVENKWSPTTGRLPDQPSCAVSEKSVSLRIYLIPDQTPRDFFSHCTQIQPVDGDVCCAGGKFKNTLIGLIEF